MNPIVLRIVGGTACVALVLLIGAATGPRPAAAKHRVCEARLSPTVRIVQPRAVLSVSGEVCRKGRVRIQQRRKGSWRGIGRTRADRGGGFSACVQLRRTGKRKVRLRAVAAAAERLTAVSRTRTCSRARRARRPGR